MTPLMRTRPICGVESRGRRAGTPAHITAGLHDTEFTLHCACAIGHAAGIRPQPIQVVRMNQGADVIDRNFEIFAIDPENMVLALVPFPLAGNEIPVPRTHMAGGEREAAALLTLQQPRIRCLEFRRSFGHAPF